MNDPSLYDTRDEMVAGPVEPLQPAPGGAFPGPYKFSPDELKVLGECNRESFYQRSLPLGTGMGLTTYLAMQKGHLKPNPRFGAMPKVTLAVVVGYFIGKLSYQEACAEKLMALPGSYIGNLLRQRKEGKVKGSSMSPQQSPTMFGANPGDIYSDAGPGNSLDLDTERPLFSDDTYRPTDTEGLTAPPEAPRIRSGMSYDELRRRNRGEYRDSKQDPYRVDPSGVPPVPIRPPAPPPAPRRHTNKYGDDME